MTVFSLSKTWMITDLSLGESIMGQFPPSNVVKDLAGDVAEAGMVNSDTTILQWVGGRTDTVTFGAYLHTDDNTDRSVEQKLKRLEDLVKRSSFQPHPPICRFSMASFKTLSIDCLVTSLGGISYDEAMADGTPMGVTLNITLKRYQELQFKVTDPTIPQTFTRMRRAIRGETYEEIAQDEYGDALLGVLLRQLNPRTVDMHVADLAALDAVHVFPEEYLLTIPIVPQWHGMREGRGNEDAEQMLQDLLDLRAGVSTS